MSARVNRPHKPRGRPRGSENANVSCWDCGFRHTTEQRARVVARFLPSETAPIMAEFPCLFSNSQGMKRALALLGAKPNGLVWRIPKQEENPDDNWQP